MFWKSALSDDPLLSRRGRRAEGAKLAEVQKLSSILAKKKKLVAEYMTRGVYCTTKPHLSFFSIAMHIYTHSIAPKLIAWLPTQRNDLVPQIESRVTSSRSNE